MATEDPYAVARQMLVDVINRERAEHGLGPVQLDPLASAVGDRHCQEMAENRYLAHWNMAGEKPYQRYCRAGGLDHVCENVASRSGSVGADSSPDAAFRNMAFMHANFMAEVPPADGHKQNVLNKWHTHVGIGYYQSARKFLGPEMRGEVRLCEEFLDRYVVLDSPPTTLPDDGKLTVRGRVLDPTRFGVYALLVYQDDPLRPWSIRELIASQSYPDYATQVGSVWPYQIQYEMSTGVFSASLATKLIHTGPLYVHVVLKPDPASIPYRLSPGVAMQFSTTGLITATSLVVAVPESALRASACASASTPTGRASPAAGGVSPARSSPAPSPMARAGATLAPGSAARPAARSVSPAERSGSGGRSGGSASPAPGSETGSAAASRAAAGAASAAMPIRPAVSPSRVAGSTAVAASGAGASAADQPLPEGFRGRRVQTSKMTYERKGPDPRLNRQKRVVVRELVSEDEPGIQLIRRFELHATGPVDEEELESLMQQLMSR